MNLADYFKNAKAYFWNEKFAIVKSKNTYPDAFVNIIDKDEITIIIDQEKIKEEDIIEIEKNWRVLTLDVIFPMDVVGVTAKISNLFAEHKISIMPIAAYSRDHFLIKDKDLKVAVKALESLGLLII